MTRRCRSAARAASAAGRSPERGSCSGCAASFSAAHQGAEQAAATLPSACSAARGGVVSLRPAVRSGCGARKCSDHDAAPRSSTRGVKPHLAPMLPAAGATASSSAHGSSSQRRGRATAGEAAARGWNTGGSSAAVAAALRDSTAVCGAQCHDACGAVRVRPAAALRRARCRRVREACKAAWLSQRLVARRAIRSGFHKMSLQLHDALAALPAAAAASSAAGAARGVVAPSVDECAALCRTARSARVSGAGMAPGHRRAHAGGPGNAAGTRLVLALADLSTIRPGPHPYNSREKRHMSSAAARTPGDAACAAASSRARTRRGSTRRVSEA